MAFTVLSSELFPMEVDVPVAFLPRVSAPAEVDQYLKDAQMGPAAGKTMLTTLCRVHEGEINEVSLHIVAPRGRTKLALRLKANKVWIEAEDDWVLSMEKDFGAFVFKAGANQSEWLPASKLKLQYYSEYSADPKKRKKLSEAEKIKKKMSDFMVRLAVVPSEDPKFATVLWVTLPVTETGMKDLLSPELAKHSRGYPVQFLCKDTAMPIGPQPAAGDLSFGIPQQPILVYIGGVDSTEETELPSSADVLSSVRSFYNKTSCPRILSCADWAQAAAMDPVVSDTNRSEFVWPFDEQVASGGDEEGKRKSLFGHYEKL